MARVTTTTQFAKCLRELRRRGKKGKDAEMKARAAAQQAASDGEITIVPRTRHGEDRFPGAEKYDLGDGYRLVVQVVGSKENIRAFLFVGNHDEADQWLENHKNYKWVKRDSDNTLEFVQATESAHLRPALATPDTESPESTLRLPLLRALSAEEWEVLDLPQRAEDYTRQLTADDWERDQDGIFEHVAELSDSDTACLCLDLFYHAHRHEWNALRRRIELRQGASRVADDSELAAAMLDPANSETFVTWEETEQLPKDASWADWMLFLHPEQRALARQDFAGPARLRGVSGSGKTCVIVHRARYLAKKYNQNVLILTLTESMRKLLDNLVRDLCGVEQTRIATSTLHRLAFDVIETLHPKGISWFTMATDERLADMQAGAAALVRKHPDFPESALSRLDESALVSFVRDEIRYVRSRLRCSEYGDYPFTRSFHRHGRGLGLGERERRMCLDAIRYWDRQLTESRTLDHEGVVQEAEKLLGPHGPSLRRSGWSDTEISSLLKRIGQTIEQGKWARCVLVDEVQDLSQLELSLLGALPLTLEQRLSSAPNGLFLVGDGAQTVYVKGFSLKKSWINVANRSYVLKKNYRNSREIVAAAYTLIREYEFADVDEDNIQIPTEPDLASRHGERPVLVKCKSFRDQVEFVTNQITQLLDTHRSTYEVEEGAQASPLQLCVIGVSRGDRMEIARALQAAGVECVELREDAGFETEVVKISTIESAKGHEFQVVFIVGLVEGAIPRRGVCPEEIPREAARLYVAMTRARDTLYMTYASSQRDRPSRFLAAIQGDCEEMAYDMGHLRAIMQ